MTARRKSTARASTPALGLAESMAFLGFNSGAVSDADAERTATELAGPPVDSPAANAYAPAPEPPHTPPAAPKSAFPYRLPDRSWGASVEGSAVIGDRIRVTTRGGKSWGATVTAVVGEHAGRTLVASQGDDPPEARTRTEHAPPRGRGRAHPCIGARMNHARIGGRDYFQNPNGRCEDAPCCGCCS